MITINFKLVDGGKLPSRGSEHAAGFDIHCLHPLTIWPGQRALVSTGVKLADCPNECYLRVAPRSKLANQYGIDVLAGVVDSDYRGEIGVILQNHGDDIFNCEAGSAVAQLVPTLLACYEVEEVSNASQSERGAAGINDKDLRL